MASGPPAVIRAAEAIRQAKAIVITAGAGMGVDSGLPDFRGPQGFWKAYPPLKKMNLTLSQMSTPSWFLEDPTFAWGFFGHRYKLYKNTTPHEGFHILRKWTRQMDKGYFVFTSNVDGHFQKAGFSEDRLIECHGSINYLQLVNCDSNHIIWPVPPDFDPKVDESTLHAAEPLPRGPPLDPQGLARPNILMFGDWDWVSHRTDGQQTRFNQFVSNLKADPHTPFVVVEIGAGLAVPTVRFQGEMLVERSKEGVLIRINPNEPQVNRDRDVSLQMTGLQALKLIDKALENV
ncbi:uncharacterized protein LOC106159559 [Lingula anatina]|uniref:Uncharacterized protein LOC106159559 n=1 Tax=Lingula anatina TaxID=7574 RepID=A0A1S3HZ77_LINAN|nr:uncharacterized protein LOC106159559 [Lingula anatina]|eukprot:XP_013391325.1 uncharacterized protein LOC106159559 [Lingula anatina]